jgi:isoleucyl-tRNA synthetase
MDAVREIASLGLAARAAKKLKVRQPLSKAVIILSDGVMSGAISRLSDVIKEEINVKEIEFAADAQTYVSYTVKPNFKTLGPKLGSRMKECAAAVAKVDPVKIVADVEANGQYVLDFGGEDFVLNAEDVDIRIEAKDGFAAATGRSAVVVLDSTVTPELELEGLARELVNRIQNLRKELDLAYEARIEVNIDADGDMELAAKTHAETIAAETLCNKLSLEFSELDETRELNIAGFDIKLSIKQV